MGMTMQRTFTDIPGVLTVKSQKIQDGRGAFQRVYCRAGLDDVIKDRQLTQANLSLTREVGTIRGLHYQTGQSAEMKLVRCIRGKVWDVALDLRTSSPTYLTWVAVELSADNDLMIVIPEGCAHGFQALEPNSEMLYLHTNFYSADLEAGLRYNDPIINITWPMPASVVSERDQAHPLIDKTFMGVSL